MGYTQELINEIKYEEILKNKEQKKEIEREVEEEFLLAFEQELLGDLEYNRSAQRLIDTVK